MMMMTRSEAKSIANDLIKENTIEDILACEFDELETYFFEVKITRADWVLIQDFLPLNLHGSLNTFGAFAFHAAQ
jgi:hypothetical protein